MTYEKMTHEEFVDILHEVVNEKCTIDELIDMPDIYSYLSEEFNNDVLDRWAEKYNDRFYDQIKRVKVAYGEEIDDMLNNIIVALRQSGFAVKNFYSPRDDDDTYRWGFEVNDLSIELEIVDSKECNDSYDGINFSVMVIDNESVIHAHLSPYNYSEECWVDVFNDGKIAERFQDFYSDMEDFVCIVGKIFDKRNFENHM